MKLRFFVGLLISASWMNGAWGVDTKISALPDGGTVQVTDQVPVNRAGTTNRVVVGTLATKSVLVAADIQTLAPVWTGNQEIATAEPRSILTETDLGADLKKYDWDLQSGVYCLRTRTDADGAGLNALCVTRGTTTNITDISLGNATNNPTFNMLGTGTSTFGGRLTGGGLNVTSASAVPTGAVLGAANQLTFYTNGSPRGDFMSGGNLQVRFGAQSAGTKPTVTGCSNSATLGGAVAGSFVSGTTGTCTVTITLPTGPTNGYACFAHDDTTAVDYTQSAIVTSVTTLTISGTTVTGDKVVWACPLGY